MAGFVTLILINDALRHRHPEIPSSETFMVIHRYRDSFAALGTDEDVRRTPPMQWAAARAAELRVSFVEPAEFVMFGFDRPAGRWYGYDLRSFTNGSGWAGPSPTSPVIRARAVAA